MSQRKRKRKDEDEDIDNLITEKSKKRRKKVQSSQDDDGELDLEATPMFTRGKIVRMQLHNFMTYNDVSIEPGPGLNLILGPNGTGKSSIVSAFCIGLGGKPKVMGRGSSIGSYIKHGSTGGAFIEVELKRSRGKNCVIRRNIKKNSSSWKMDGKQASYEKVKQRIRSFGIQFDNLTQFLPQDKVSEFACLTPIELLKWTSDSILKPEEVAYFAKLVELQKNTSGDLNMIEMKDKELLMMKKDIVHYEREMEKYLQRMTHLRKAELCGVKKLFIQFSDKQTEARYCKNEHNTAQEELAKFERNETPLRRKITDKKEIQKEADKKKRELKTEMKTVFRQLNRVASRLNDLADECANEREKLDHLFEKANDDKDRKERLEELIEQLERKVAQFPSAQELKSQYKEITDQKKEQEEKLDEAQNKREQIEDELHDKEQERQQLIDTLKKFKDKKRQKIRRIRQFARQESKCWDWVVNNQARLRDKVWFLPLEIDIVPKWKKHAAKLEYHVENRMWKSVIYINNEDRDFIHNSLVPRKIGKLSIIGVPTRRREKNHPFTIEEMKPYGAECYLDEVFTAPQEIMNVLFNTSGVDNVVILKHGKKVEEFFARFGNKIRYVFTPDARYRYVISRYRDNTTSIVNNSYSKQQRVTFSINAEEKDKMEDELRELDEGAKRITRKLTEIRKEEETYQSRVREFRDQEKKIRRENSKRKGVKKKILIKKKELSRIKLEDVKRKEAELVKNMRKINAKRVVLAGELAEQIERYAELSDDFSCWCLRYAKAHQELQHLLHQQEEEREKLTQLRMKVATLQTRFDGLKIELRRLRQAALNGKDAFILKHTMEEDDFKMKMLGLPDDLETVETIYQQEQDKADALVADSDSVVNYETRKKEMEDLEEELMTLKASRRNIEKKMKDLEKKWKDPLADKLERVNETFTEFCKDIGIAGEVSLNVVRNDYAKSTLDIRVKFRQKEKLTLLSAQRQSGGEKSVTTMLYMLALQRETKTPFFVVDEINQGMDPVNERKVFLQMLKSCRGRDVPQSFVITPKLLPDLVPNEARNISVFFIMNGAYGIDDREYRKWSDDILRL